MGMEQKSRQATIKDWTEIGKEEAGIIPEGRIEKKESKKPPPPLKRKRGKLSKKQQVEKKGRQKDISWLLAPPPPQETLIHERAMARGTEEMEIGDEEKEECLERMKRKSLEWRTRCRENGKSADPLEMFEGGRRGNDGDPGGGGSKD